MNELVLGQEIVISNAIVYPRYCIKKSNIVKSGTFYIYNDIIMNNRIRITNKKEYVNVPGHVVGWVSIKSIKGYDNVSIGDMVIVNGNIKKNPDGTGSAILKSDSNMYVVQMLDNSYTYNIGVATGPNRTIQGWANESIVKLA